MLLTVYLYVILGLGRVGPSPAFLVHCPISIPTCSPTKVLQPEEAPGRRESHERPLALSVLAVMDRATLTVTWPSELGEALGSVRGRPGG